MAGTSLESFGGNAVSSVRKLSLNQQIMLGAAFVGVVGLVWFVGQLGGSTSMGILYSDLEPTVAAGIVDELETRGVPYELSDSGRVILVPRDQVAATRLDMSAAGLPAASGGWSILDDQGITSSEFDQRVGYQRAMEGELASTIAVIDGVSSANVHLVIPEQDLFVGDEIMASASVLLVLDGAEPLAAQQIQAIVNLVASSVEGLTAANVTVTDDAGRLLSGGDADGIIGMEADNQVRMQASFESDVESEISSLLAAVVGEGRAVVTVKANLDFDTVTTTEESFLEPLTAAGATLPQQETTRVEEYNNAQAGDTGVVDIETEILDGAVPENGAGSFYTLTERDVAYALDRVVTSTERAPGTIRNLSVAVVIDETLVTPEQLPELERIVGAAVGVDLVRGDTVAVSLLPFDVSLEEQEEAALAAEEAAAGTGSGDSLGLIRTIGSIIVALVVLVLGVLMLRRGSKRTVVDSLDLSELPTGDNDGENGPSGESSAALPRAATEENLSELIANQPEDIAVVLRQWLTQPEASR